jgi:gliding motility-associated-like protein
VGYTYGWSPTSTAGFINQNTNWTNTTFTNAVGGNDVNNIANPGVYQAVGNLCDFVGCPLNGDWTFNVLDNLAADNGYIFYWGIDFNPNLFPDITTFTPVIGLQSDSTFWQGPNIVFTSSNGNLIEVLHDTPGFYNYTFFATNNFGCTFDTTVTLEVIVGPSITAGPDVTVCDTPVMLQAGLAGSEQASCNNSGGQYTYCYDNNANLIVTYCPDNPNDGVTFMGMNILQGSVENFWDNFFVYDGNNIGAPLLAGPLTGNLQGLSFTATNPSGCITWRITSDGSVSCQSSGFIPELIISVNCQGGGNLVWSWDPPTGLSNPNAQNPMVLVNQTTVYTVSAYPPAFPGCVVTDQVIVSPDASANPGLNTNLVLCYNEPAGTLLSFLNGNPTPGGTFTNNANQQIAANQFNPADFPNGGNFSYTYTISNGQCTNTSVLTIQVLPSTNSSCCQVNAVAGEDAFPCSLTYQLKAELPVGTGTWSGPPNVTFSNINDPNATVTCTSPGGIITLTWTDNNGFLCSASDQVTIYFSEPVSAFVVPTDALCNGECSGTAIAIGGGGTTTGGVYIYAWSGGTEGIAPFVRDGLCPGTHKVVITDNVGCTDSTEFFIGQPPAMMLAAQGFAPLCADSCNGRIVVVSQGAVEYSFDAGITWQEENEALLCAGLHGVMVRNENNCVVSTVVTLNDPPRYTAAFNVNPNKTTTEQTLITVQDISFPGPIATSLFSFGLNPVLGTSTDRFASFRFPSDTSGTYQIRLITTNANGCVDTLTKQVIINDELLWFIPNSFTPNGDGINDIWRPLAQTADFRDYRVGIYDRWGREIWTTTDYTRGWNGGVQGSDYFAEAGVYTYLIKVSSATTEAKYELTGFIMLLR